METVACSRQGTYRQHGTGKAQCSWPNKSALLHSTAQLGLGCVLTLVVAAQPCWKVSVVSPSCANPEAGKEFILPALCLLSCYNQWSDLGPCSRRVAAACSSVKFGHQVQGKKYRKLNLSIHSGSELFWKSLQCYYLFLPKPKSNQVLQSDFQTLGNLHSLGKK